MLRIYVDHAELKTTLNLPKLCSALETSNARSCLCALDVAVPSDLRSEILGQVLVQVNDAVDSENANSEEVARIISQKKSMIPQSAPIKQEFSARVAIDTTQEDLWSLASLFTHAESIPGTLMSLVPPMPLIKQFQLFLQCQLYQFQFYGSAEDCLHDILVDPFAKPLSLKAKVAKQNMELIFAGPVSLNRANGSTKVCTAFGLSFWAHGSEVKNLGSDCCVPAWLVPTRNKDEEVSMETASRNASAGTTTLTLILHNVQCRAQGVVRRSQHFGEIILTLSSSEVCLPSYLQWRETKQIDIIEVPAIQNMPSRHS